MASLAYLVSFIRGISKAVPTICLLITPNHIWESSLCIKVKIVLRNVLIDISLALKPCLGLGRKQNHALATQTEKI